jgi:hypothetical protein
MWYSIKDMNCSGFCRTKKKLRKPEDLENVCFCDVFRIVERFLTPSPLFSLSAFAEHEA